MIERSTRIWTENLARSLNRRKFLRTTGEAAFVGMAALMSGNLTALATQGTVVPLPKVSLVPECAPPGPYCNLDGVNAPTACKGSACYRHLIGGQLYQCRIYYDWYQAGCWTTAVTGGNWSCCDCECGTPRIATCGCAQFSATPVPRPDSPTQA